MAQNPAYRPSDSYAPPISQIIFQIISPTTAISDGNKILVTWNKK